MQVSTKALLTEVTWAARFLESKTTIPILSTVLFSADGGTLTITATDLEVGGITSIAGGTGKWAVCVPVKKLIQYLAKVDESDVTIKASADHVLIVTHGTNSMRVTGMSREAFPELPTFPEPAITLRGLPLAVKRTAFCVSKEESRFTLCGANLEIIKGNANLIAADAHRLGIAPLQIANNDGEYSVNVLISKFALTEAGKLDGDCTFALDDNHVFLSWGNRRIISRKLAGNFPDYRRVTGKGEYYGHCMLPAKSTLKVLDRVAVCADERSRAMQFTVKDSKLTLYASTIETGEAQGSVAVQQAEGEVEIGLKCEYVAEFLGVTDKQFVSFAWTDKKSIVEFGTGDGYRYLLMPMRI